MLDLETLGKKPGCVISSVGAAVFDIKTGEIFDTFYVRINVFDSLMHGFSIDQSTLEWWKNQSDDSKTEFSQDTKTVWKTLDEFADWFQGVSGEQVWCQGATFDAPILEEYFMRVNPGVPWKFWNIRDTRTVYDVCDFDPQTVPRKGTYHNTLDDVKHQVTCLTGALNARS